MMQTYNVSQLPAVIGFNSQGWLWYFKLIYEWCYMLHAFSSPEATILLVSTKNRDLWPVPTPEVRESRTSRQI